MSGLLTIEAAIGLVARVVERRNTIPILSHALVDSDGKALRLTASDLDNEVSVAVGCKAPKFLTTTEAGLLRDVLTTVGAAGIHMDGHKLVVGAGPTYTLDTLPPDEFPRVKAGETTHSFELPAAQLLADLDAVSPATSSEETRYYLMGVSVDVRDEGKLTFAATDGHRLHLLRRDAPERSAGLRDSIIAKKAVKLIRAALQALPGVTTVQLRFERFKAQFEIGPVTITTKLIDGTYPDVRRVIPTSTNGKLTASADALLACAKAASLLPGDKTKAVKVDFEAGLISSKQLGAGEMTTALPGTSDGNLPAAIGFNATYFAAAMERFSGAEVTLAIADAAGPVLVTSEASPLQIVLMPLRLS